MQFHREKNKQRKKSQKGLFESLSKNQNTSTSYERRQVLFLHDRETTRRWIITAACLSDIQINTNHKQLTTNTGYAAIRYSKSRRQYSSFPRSAKPAGGFEQFHNKLCMSFWMATEGIVFLHCSYFCKCTKTPLTVTVISTAALKNSKILFVHIICEFF